MEKAKKPKKRMSLKKSLAIFTPIIAVLIALTIVLSVMLAANWETLCLFFGGRTQSTDTAILSAGTELCEDIVESGAVLLKNTNNALPLQKDMNSDEEIAVNVFGWAAYDWMTSAFGSGYSNTSLAKTKLFPALEQAGIKYNTKLYNMYKAFYSDTSNEYNKKEDEQEYRGGVAFGSEKIFTIHEPGTAFYTEEIKQSIKDTSNIALVVIGRTGSESKDLKGYQTVQEQTNKSTKNTNRTDRKYLELAKEEEEMIAVAKETCDTVIVLLNTANIMEAGFIDDEGIDAAVHAGITGLTGAKGLVNVLRGWGWEKVKTPELDEDGQPVKDDNGDIVYKKDDNGNYIYEQELDKDGNPVYEVDEEGNRVPEAVDEDGNPVKDANGNVIYKVKYKLEKVKVSPSGRTADTYAYDMETAPSFVNAPTTSTSGSNSTERNYSNGFDQSGLHADAYIDYYEGIYVGYKWYETADAEGFWDSYGGYDKVVQYPFGYGLSYTDFEWTVDETRVNNKKQDSGDLPKDGTIEIDVTVKNVGNFPAKDVVELYYTPKYKDGGIEKAAVNLADFVKTPVIQPGESRKVTLTTTVQSMASYDCYDKNKNNHTGYELDGGEHVLRIMTDSHNSVKDLAFSIPSSGYNYDKDEKTEADVKNRFTNLDGKGNDNTDEVVDNNDLDGSRESTPVEYLTRENFKLLDKRVERAATAEALAVAKAQRPTAEQLELTGYVDLEMPLHDEDYGLIMDEHILPKKNAEGEWEVQVASYDDPIWKDLLNQCSIEDLFNVVQDGYFKTATMPSISKSQIVDLDGPLGFNTRVTAASGVLCEFVAYPSATVMAQTWDTTIAYDYGASVGAESASMDGLHGWYAPGANIHRNPCGGRNGEYYSEDGVLSGKICAETVRGARDNGVYSYVKHFVLNDSELVREGLFTFVTEQALREIYLKPFEIIIKEGNGNALMTAMNRLGRTWAGATRGLLTDIVRGEWGFRGSVVTDWVNIGGDQFSYPYYKGVWAGNDLWLANGMGSKLFDKEFDVSKNSVANVSLQSLQEDEVFVTLTRNAAHNILWTLTDTLNASLVDVGEAQLNSGWFWYIAFPVFIAIAAGLGVCGFFLTRNILSAVKGKGKGKDGSASDEEAKDDKPEEKAEK